MNTTIRSRSDCIIQMSHEINLVKVKKLTSQNGIAYMKFPALKSKINTLVVRNVVSRNVLSPRPKCRGWLFKSETKYRQVNQQPNVSEQNYYHKWEESDESYKDPAYCPSYSNNDDSSCQITPVTKFNYKVKLTASVK